MIELSDDFWIAPEHVTLIRKTGENQCALFFVGQSAIDGGHLIPWAAGEVAEVVNDALENTEYEDEDREQE